MDIRRVEPDLIPPTVASDRGARVASEHQPREQQPQKHDRRHHSDTDAEDDVHLEDGGLPVTYDPEGRLHEPDAPEVEPHNIDFRA